VKGPLSGDLPLTGSQKLRYAWNALREIVTSVAERPPCSIDLLRIDRLPSDLKTPPPLGPSPFRLYQDLACVTVLREYCLKQGVILDIGCGSGGNAYQFRSAGVTGRYLGIDLHPHPHWPAIERTSENEALKCEFQVLDAEELDDLGQFDLVFSTSTLEHIRDVETAVKNIARLTSEGGFSFHAVPAPFSIFLYSAHGFRRFSAGRAADLFRRSGLHIQAIVGLGGFGSFLAHMLFITLPARISKKELRAVWPKLYARSLLLALKLDRRLPFPHLGYITVAKRLPG